MKRQRRRNPSMFDLVTLTVVAGAGIYIVSKFGGLGSGIGSPKAPVYCNDGQHHFQVRAKHWTRYMRTDERTMDVTWTISHCGPAGRYWAGVHLRRAVQNPFDITDQESQEQFFDVQNDDGWSTWDMSARLQFATVPTSGAYHMFVYVADEHNNRLAEEDIFMGVFTLL